MSDVNQKCPHGARAHLIERPDLGSGWVQPVAGDCHLCEAEPDRQRLPYLPGELSQLNCQPSP